jgi:hypothetical protein
MSAPILITDSLLVDDAWYLLQEQSPDALVQWIARTLVEYLEGEEGEWRRRLLSFAWILTVLREPEQLRQIAKVLAFVTSTSDVGLDTALINLFSAKIAMSESHIAKHNGHWLHTARTLNELPEFRPRGFIIAQRVVNDMLSQYS